MGQSKNVAPLNLKIAQDILYVENGDLVSNRGRNYLTHILLNNGVKFDVCQMVNAADLGETQERS